MGRTIQEKVVHLTILVSGDKHCSNDCIGMSIDADYCEVFKVRLEWDKRRKLDGNQRPGICRGAEQVKDEKERLGRPDR